MASKDKTTAHITETDKSDYAVSIEVNGYTLDGDEPKSFGGGGTAPAPYDLLLASLGECTAMTVRWYAIQQKWPLDKVEVSLTHEKIDKTDHFEKTITITGDKLTEEQRQKLVTIAAKCPIQRTLEGKVEIRTV